MFERHFVMKRNIVLSAVVAFLGLSFFGNYHGRVPSSHEISPRKYSESKAHQKSYERRCAVFPISSISQRVNYLPFKPSHEKSCIDWFFSEPFKLLDSTIRERTGCLRCHTVNGIRILAEKYNYGEDIIHP